MGFDSDIINNVPQFIEFDGKKIFFKEVTVAEYFDIDNNMIVLNVLWEYKFVHQ